MGSSHGRTFSKVALSPPIMKVRAPFSAPGLEPVQGAPRKPTPLAASASPTLILDDGVTVEASTTTDPGFAPLIMPSAPRMTSSDILVSPTHKKTHSDAAATSRGVAQAIAFSSAANFRALSAVKDQTESECPARARLRAMG